MSLGHKGFQAQTPPITGFLRGSPGFAPEHRLSCRNTPDQRNSQRFPADGSTTSVYVTVVTYQVSDGVPDDKQGEGAGRALDGLDRALVLGHRPGCGGRSRVHQLSHSGRTSGHWSACTSHAAWCNTSTGPWCHPGMTPQPRRARPGTGTTPGAPRPSWAVLGPRAGAVLVSPPWARSRGQPASPAGRDPLRQTGRRPNRTGWRSSRDNDGGVGRPRRHPCTDAVCDPLQGCRVSASVVALQRVDGGRPPFPPGRTAPPRPGVDRHHDDPRRRADPPVTQVVRPPARPPRWTAGGCAGPDRSGAGPRWPAAG